MPPRPPPSPRFPARCTAAPTKKCCACCRDRHQGPRPRVRPPGQGGPRQADGLWPPGLQELRSARAHHQTGGRRGVPGDRPQPQDRYRHRTGAHRAFRRVLHQAQALPQRGFLFRHHLPGHGLHPGPVHGAVRHPAHGRLAGAMAGAAARFGTENRPPAPDLYRRRRPRLRPHGAARPAPNWPRCNQASRTAADAVQSRL